MHRLFFRAAVPSAFLAVLHACGGSGGETPGGETPGGADASLQDAAAAGEAATDAAGRDASADRSEPPDAANDGGVDAAPGIPTVTFIGRFDKTPAAGPKTAWPAARIIARFSGTEVKATLADTMLFGDYGASRWEVLVDGASTMTFQVARPGPTTYTLATGLPAGIHTVELYLLTEGSVGTSQFMGFDFSGGTLLPPPPAKTRHLEFLGDSSSNGYGLDGVPGCTFSAATENAHKAYPALIAEDLAADHQNLSASGKGLYQNNYRPDTEVFSVLYPRTLPHSGAVLWNFNDYTPDVVWVSLGGNDYDGSSMPPDVPPAGQFQAKYDELVTTIRAKHPAAHIFCAIAPSLSDVYPPNYMAYTNVKTAASNVVTAHAGAGDTKIYYFEFTRSGNGETTACDGHPNIAKHRAMADEAVLKIKSKTGW